MGGGGEEERKKESGRGIHYVWLTYSRGVLVTIQSKNQLFPEWIEVGILSLPSGDDFIVVLYQLGVVLLVKQLQLIQLEEL